VEGACTSSLGNEDTWANAKARALALIPGWSGCDSCGSCSSFVSFISGISYSFSEVQVQATITGGEVGQQYKVIVSLASRAYGSSGDYTGCGTIEFIVTYTTGLNVTGWQDLPVGLGIEVIATGCTVQLLS